MFKKWGRYILASILTVSLLTACSGNAGVEPVNTETTKVKESLKPQESPKPQEPVEITIMHHNGAWSEEQTAKAFAEPIMKKYPHIKVKAIGFKGKSLDEELAEMVVTGNLPDLIMTTAGLGYDTTIRKYKGEYDLSPLIQQYNYDLDQLDPAALQVVQNLSGNKELYSLPIYMSPNTLYYNKAIFEKFGVAFPKEGMTWDDVYDLTKKLTRNENGVQYRGFMLSGFHLMRLNQVSQKMFDSTEEKVAFDTPEYKNYLKDIFRIYDLPGYDMDQVLQAANLDLFLKDQTVAMLEPGGVLIDEEALAGLGDQWDFTSFPSLKDKAGAGYQPYPFIISMFNSSKHKEEAFQAMAYLTSAEFQTEATKQGKLLPVLKDKSMVALFGQDSAFYKGKNVGALLPKQFTPVPDEPSSEYTSIAQSELMNIYASAVHGRVELNTAFREATESANKKIQEMKAAKGTQ
ncbi:ABC transporter substrate-binding protein [Paenibacillus eucommiae]|uniref:Multiple sugar transport system substrate-binding protein n=1 Tax=Paenibacillus eucommiae TaxID=1355755 RepID=A0ABS4JB40_9BACL|nr:extracellular solute-binding protein [Paenibacillus eucommiae]MBP1997053.1 multiple sugar transport system substrate-binding protein [Paenibacillus eucommiae]